MLFAISFGLTVGIVFGTAAAVLLTLWLWLGRDDDADEPVESIDWDRFMRDLAAWSASARFRRP